MKRKIILIMFMFVFATIFNMPYKKIYAMNEVDAKSYIVTDDFGNVLISKNEHDKMPVASICKLMTTLITLEKIDSGEITLDDYFVASEYACNAEGSQAFLDYNQKYLVKDLLKSVIIASANDSAIVLAENIAGSEDAFVSMMNGKAKEIEMKDTLYANSTGLDDKINQYSTAYDTSLIINLISKFDLYLQYSNIWIDELIHPSGRKTELVNTNRLIKYYNDCKSGKTGFTPDAGYCLSSTATRNNMNLCCVVLGCDSSANRFKDSILLYNYVFANYKLNKIIDKSVLPNLEVSVLKGNEDKVGLCYQNDFEWIQKNDDNSCVDIVYNIPTAIEAPIKVGDVVGDAILYLNNNVIGRVNIVTTNSIEKQNYHDIISKIASRFLLG